MRGICVVAIRSVIMTHYLLLKFFESCMDRCSLIAYCFVFIFSSVRQPVA